MKEFQSVLNYKIFVELLNCGTDVAIMETKSFVNCLKSVNSKHKLWNWDTVN